MPCSTWTTKSPAARLRRSSRNGRVVSVALRALAAPVGARAEDLLLGDQHEALGREHHAARERADDDLAPSLGRLVEPRRVERREARLARDALVAEQRDEPLGLRLRARRDEDAQAVLAPVRDAPHERGERRVLALRRARRLHRARRGPRGRAPRGPAARAPTSNALEAARRPRRAIGGAVQRDHGARARARRERLLVAVERHRQERSAPALLLGVASLGARAARRARARVTDGGSSRTTTASSRHVREQRVELVVVRRQVPLGAEEGARRHDVVDQRARLGRRPVDRLGRAASTRARARATCAASRIASRTGGSHSCLDARARPCVVVCSIGIERLHRRARGRRRARPAPASRSTAATRRGARRAPRSSPGPRRRARAGTRPRRAPHEGVAIELRVGHDALGAPRELLARRRPCARGPRAGTTSTRHGCSCARWKSVAMRLIAARRSGFTSA